MSHSKINYALLTRLTTLANAPLIANENRPFTPENGVLYLRENYIPANTASVGIGTTDSSDYRGIYQVSIYAPMDSAKFETLNLIDAIESHFAKGTVLVYDGLSVKIQQVNTAAGMGSGDRWMTPISINWRAFA